MKDLDQSKPLRSRTSRPRYRPDGVPQLKHASENCILVIEAGQAILTLLESEPNYSSFIIDSLSASEVELKNAYGRYNIVILDVDIHHHNGVTLLRQLRHDRPVLPILVLTASTAIDDKVELLQTGADDCLTKPFASVEFLARIDVLLRRSWSVIPSSLKVGELTLSRTERHVRRNQRFIPLTPKEFAILDLLMQNAGQTISRATILREVWNLPPETPSNLVEVYINYIRGKLESPEEPKRKLIRTIRGAGYQLAHA